jgi:hypothetical protein
VQWTAAVCKGGHIVSIDVFDAGNRLESPNRVTGYAAPVLSPDVRTARIPFHRQEVAKFCGTCSAPVITACEQCGHEIPTPEYLRGATQPNAFCIGCGDPFPWATREERIGRIQSLLEYEDGLSESQRLELVEEITVLAVPEERADHKKQIKAAGSLKRLAPKAWSLAQPILVATLSAEVQAAIHVGH